MRTVIDQEQIVRHRLACQLADRHRRQGRRTGQRMRRAARQQYRIACIELQPVVLADLYPATALGDEVEGRLAPCREGHCPGLVQHIAGVLDAIEPQAQQDLGQGSTPSAGRSWGRTQ
jgi:hypothetical protein